VIFIGIFPHPRPFSQRERGERKYGEIISFPRAGAGTSRTTPNPSLVRRGVASRKSQGIFPALAKEGLGWLS